MISDRLFKRRQKHTLFHPEEERDISEIAADLNKYIQVIDDMVKDYENNQQMITFSIEYQKRASNTIPTMNPADILELLHTFERRQGFIKDHPLFSRDQAKTLRWILSNHELFIFYKVKTLFSQLVQIEMKNELVYSQLLNMRKITLKKDDILLYSPYIPDWERGGRLSLLGTLGYSRQGFALIFHYLDLFIKVRSMKIPDNPIKEIVINGEKYLEIDLKRCLTFKERSLRMIGFLALRRYMNDQHKFTNEILNKQIDIGNESQSNSFFHLSGNHLPGMEFKLIEELEGTLKSLQESFQSSKQNFQLSRTQLWDWNKEIEDMKNNLISENFKITIDEGILGISKIIDQLFGYQLLFDDYSHVSIMRNGQVVGKGVLDLFKYSKESNQHLNAYLYHGFSDNRLKFSIIESFENDYLSIHDVSRLFQKICKAIRYLIIKESSQSSVIHFGDTYLNREWSLIIDHFLELFIRDARVVFGIFRPLTLKLENSKEIIDQYNKSRENFMNSAENFLNQESIIQDIVNIKIQSLKTKGVSYFDILNSESKNLPIYNQSLLHKSFAISVLHGNQARLGRRNVINEVKYKQFAYSMWHQHVSMAEEPLSDRQIRKFLYKLLSLPSNCDVSELMRRITR